MKEIILYRHAEAETPDGGRPDHERRLTPKGRTTAQLVGSRLRVHNVIPERVLCSDARRAVETAELSAETAGVPAAPERVPELYTGGADEYIGIFADQPAELNRVMVIGHNPVVEEVLERFTGAHRRMRPGEAAVLQFVLADWGLIAADHSATLIGVLPNEPLSAGQSPITHITDRTTADA